MSYATLCRSLVDDCESTLRTLLTKFPPAIPLWQEAFSLGALIRDWVCQEVRAEGGFEAQQQQQQ